MVYLNNQFRTCTARTASAFGVVPIIQKTRIGGAGSAPIELARFCGKKILYGVWISHQSAGKIKLLILSARFIDLASCCEDAEK